MLTIYRVPPDRYNYKESLSDFYTEIHRILYHCEINRKNSLLNDCVAYHAFQE